MKKFNSTWNAALETQLSSFTRGEVMCSSLELESYAWGTEAPAILNGKCEGPETSSTIPHVRCRSLNVSNCQSTVEQMSSGFGFGPGQYVVGRHNHAGGVVPKSTPLRSNTVVWVASNADFTMITSLFKGTTPVPLKQPDTHDPPTGYGLHAQL